jgi:hypothetical protein
MSIKSRLATPERRHAEAEPLRNLTFDECMEALGGGAYGSIWILDLYGTHNPWDEAVDRAFGPLRTYYAGSLACDSPHIEECNGKSGT